MTSLFGLQFWVLTPYKKTKDMFGILRKFLRTFLSQKHVLLREKCWFENWTLFGLTLTWRPSKVQKTPYGPAATSVDIQVQNDPENVCRAACLWLLFCSDFLNLTLTFLSMTLVLTQYPSQTFISTLGEFELFASFLTDSMAQNVKTMFFYPWPDTWRPS